MNLSADGASAARRFLVQHGRPLEQALYAFHFERGPADAVLDALTPYQNSDGGFGHGLEPDLQLADSSAIVTTVGLQHLRDVKAGADNPLVQRAIAYLLTTYDPSIQTWQIIPANVDDAPHAPWWAYDDELSHRWHGFLANPRAEIVGYLVAYAALVPPELLTELGAAVVAHLEANPQPEMHDLLCYIRLVETEALPGALRERMLPLLSAVIDETVARDASAWAEYGLQPLTVVSSPESPFAGLLADALPANLDYLVQQQGEDGAWAPNWSWFGLYDEAWPASERAWKGVLTVKALRQLRAFGRL
ncbi:MAG: hypothetical protein M9927_20240 [Anaerolineae bacterium]|nr:hypothetical protein [Anaerolineae bacterium]HRX03652.1 hypothetical protein [Anaerolineae bacterium]